MNDAHGLETVAIYALCDANGDIRYIGKANNPQKRLASHMRDCHRRKTPVYAWIRKHGKPKMRVLEWCSIDEWEDRERSAIARHRDNGCNLLNVADGGRLPGNTVAGRKVAIAKRQAGLNRKVWELNRMAGQALRHEWIDHHGFERFKENLRILAKLQPENYGRWSNV